MHWPKTNLKAKSKKKFRSKVKHKMELFSSKRTAFIPGMILFLVLLSTNSRNFVASVPVGSGHVENVGIKGT